MPTTLDFVYLGVFAVAWPLYEYFVGWPRFQRLLREQPLRARPRVYRLTIVAQWLLVAAGIALWVPAARPWSSLGLQAPTGWTLWLSAGASLALAAAYVRQAIKVARNPRAKLALRKALGSLEEILPHSDAEFAWFLIVSITAGFCEEFLFRGYFIWTMAPRLGWWGAAALSVAVFGCLHAYQGPKGIVRTGLVGAVLTLVVASTDSLLPAVALHTVVDIGSGWVTWVALREVVPAGEEPTAPTATREVELPVTDD